MKNILVIGATGQIGSELTLELRKRYGDDHVVAGYIPSAMPKGELKASGPSAIADVTDSPSRWWRVSSRLILSTIWPPCSR